ncbi:MFS transporter [Salicibibacter kimchii]|uniref:MFS transporter n=1 Tax=Salicibibacter kimchii TaxID=2099786 RepID=A0A345C300_9BACI|nr:MFS transporter [Salicibibacter kimchii]AXF57581.1 MFS transporter [Salicibibacter kimchii]
MFARNFNVLLAGMFTKGLGEGVYLIAGMMLVLELTGDPFYSGLALFAISIPTCIGFLIAPISNYFSYKLGLIVCEFLKAFLLLLIPLLFFNDFLHVSVVIMTMFVISLISQFTYPIESTLIPSVAGKEHVVKANSIINMMRESLDIAFFGAAGVLVAYFGSAETLLITMVFHFSTAIVYTFFKLDGIDRQNPIELNTFVQNYLKDFGEGFRYVKDSIIPHIVIAAVAVNFFLGSMMAALPTFALSNGNESFYGYYMVAMTAGLFLGSLSAQKLKRISYGKLNILASLLAGQCWVAAAFFPPIFSIVSFGAGFIAVGVINIMIFSAIQQQVESRMIGRVISVVSSASAISLPIGTLTGGMMASVFGSAFPIILGGVGLSLYGCYWLCHPALRSLPVIDHLKLVKNTEAEKDYA